MAALRNWLRLGAATLCATATIAHGQADQEDGVADAMKRLRLSKFEVLQQACTGALVLTGRNAPEPGQNPMVYRLPYCYQAKTEYDAEQAKKQALIPPMVPALASALVKSFAKAPAYAVARRMGAQKLTPTTMSIEVTGASELYEFAVADDVKCTATGPGSQRCTYRYQVSYTLTAGGIPLPTATSSWVSRSDIFAGLKNALVSAALDRDMAQTAERITSKRASTGSQSPTVAGPNGNMLICAMNKMPVCF